MNSRRQPTGNAKTKIPLPMTISEFRSMAKKNFLYNLKSGHLLDLTKKIEEHEMITRTGLERALKEAEMSVKSIDLFLADQLKDDSSLQSELKVVEQLKRKKEKELDLALNKMGDFKVDLFKKIESIRDTMRCRDFLHTVSPRGWMNSYRVLSEREQLKRQPDMEKLNEEFKSFMFHMGDLDNEIEKIVKEFVEIFQNAGPEILPFKEGGEISGVIKKMEKNNMEMLVHVRSFQQPLEEQRRMLKDVTDIFKEEINEVLRTLSEITGSYSFLKERNARLDSVIHDTLKNFKEQVASSDVLKDRALLESLYKDVLNVKKPKSSALEMWKEIDQAFIDLMCKVGTFSRNEIERRRISINQLNAKRLKEAEKARNRVTQMEQMVKGVRKSFWAPYEPRIGKPTKPRSEPPPAPLASPPPSSPPGEDYTLELLYQTKLVQPLAVSYDLPVPPKSSSIHDVYLQRRHSIHSDGSYSPDLEEEIEEISENQFSEIPSLPKMEKFKTTTEEPESQET